MNNERQNNLLAYERKIVHELKRCDNMSNQTKNEKLMDNSVNKRNLRESSNLEVKPFFFQTTNGPGINNVPNSNLNPFLNLNELDNIFCKLLKNSDSHNSEIFNSEKVRLLRGINFIFKKNSTLYKDCQIHMSQQETLKSHNINNPPEKLVGQPDSNNAELISKNLFATYSKNENANKRTNPVEQVLVNTNENSFLNKKRMMNSDLNTKFNNTEIDKVKVELPIVPQSDNYNSPDDFFFNAKKSSEIPLNERLEKSKRVLEKTSFRRSGSNRSDTKDSTDQKNKSDSFILNSISNNNLNFLNNKSNSATSITQSNENSSSLTSSSAIPILVKSYPENPSNKIQVNMNITNININQKNNTPIIKNMIVTSKYDQDAKLILELKETLRKRSINFCEDHSSTNYILNFRVPFESSYKIYEIAIDNESSKILSYKKARDKDIIIAINNTEDSAANLIFNELGSIKNDIEKGFNVKLNI